MMAVSATTLYSWLCGRFLFFWPRFGHNSVLRSSATILTMANTLQVRKNLMAQSVKPSRKTVASGEERAGKKSQREGDLLRENLKRRKLQARTKTRSEESRRVRVADD